MPPSACSVLHQSRYLWGETPTLRGASEGTEVFAPTATPLFTHLEKGEWFLSTASSFTFSHTIYISISRRQQVFAVFLHLTTHTYQYQYDTSLPLVVVYGVGVLKARKEFRASYWLPKLLKFCIDSELCKLVQWFKANSLYHQRLTVTTRLEPVSYFATDFVICLKIFISYFNHIPLADLKYVAVFWFYGTSYSRSWLTEHT